MNNNQQQIKEIDWKKGIISKEEADRLIERFKTVIKKFSKQISVIKGKVKN